MFGKKLKMLRKKAGFTQANLAKKLGISPSSVGMYEQGRREPDSVMLVKIAELFDVQRPAITKHLNNIFNENELDKSSVCSKMEHTAEDGKKYQT